jgi:hypothetical protein
MSTSRGRDCTFTENDRPNINRFHFVVEGGNVTLSTKRSTISNKTTRDATASPLNSQMSRREFTVQPVLMRYSKFAVTVAPD